MRSSIGEYTRESGSEPLGLRRSRTLRLSWRAMVRARVRDSALRVPSTRMVSPCSATTARMNAFDGLIFNCSVHHRNFGLGAAWPRPMRHAQNKSSTAGVQVDPVDGTCRRLMNRQLTMQESRPRLARAMCHGGRSQIRQAYREGQEDESASPGLVLNAVGL